MKADQQRIVVTGMGTITAYGAGSAALINGCLSGRNTIRTICRFDPTGLPATIASEVDSSLLGSAPETFHSHASRMAWVAAHEAIDQSECQPEALSAAIGWSAPPASLLESSLSTDEKMEQWEQHPSAPEAQPGEAARLLYEHLKCTGPLLTDHAACSASLHSLVHAARLIRSGLVSTCLAGAADSRVHPSGIIGYSRIGALNTEDNDQPDRASRPFSKDRAGFVVGEGAGFFMLESLEHALKRDATIWAELAGWSLTNDADNLTDPKLDGSYAIRCIQQCLEHAGCAPEDIDYINAHGTSTPHNDQMECMAYRTIWPENGPAISSSKSMIGHLSMASSAVESIVTLGSLQQGVLPPTLNLSKPDLLTQGLDIIGAEPRRHPIQTALKTAFGLGGQNAAVVWKKYS